METTEEAFVLDKESIRLKKEKLAEIKLKLKNDFVGIDDIIDNLFEYIQIWYLMPNILSRPVIVCLWGMTGVGKTDLIRKLVKYLDFQDRFAEVELGNSDGTSYYSSVVKLLEQFGVHDERPSIALFDEIQRFYTIQADGSPVPHTKFTDFWELLSDGKLARREKNDLDWYINEFIFRKRKQSKQPEEEYHEDSINFWEAQNFKNSLGVEDINDFLEMTESQLLEKISEAKKKKKIYEPVDHSQTLIIVSGNLDEAFQMAHQTSESDIDADIFHAFTKKITSVDIKNALATRFRPEQVARFGNIHLIYPSLRKVDFQMLIKKEVAKIIERSLLKFNIDLKVTENVERLIYHNGVFPVQGVRPVFSSITDILETHVSHFIFEALLKDVNKITIDYDFSEKTIFAKIGKKTHKIPFIGRIDKIREAQVDDLVMNVSVHESGHAVLYMLLFGLVPLQLKSKVASSYASGFTFPHLIYDTQENLLKKVRVYLAGGLAEELIFGKKNATIGRSHDREQATILVTDYIRRYGFDKNFQAVYTLDDAYELQKQVTDEKIEKMLSALVKETRLILETNLEFLKSLSQILFEKGSMKATEMKQIAELSGVEVEIREEGYRHLPKYTDLI